MASKRTVSRLGEFAAIGALSGGGVCRPALSPIDRTARSHLTAIAKSSGLLVFVDQFANQFFRMSRTVLVPDADPVLSGSHLDTQPHGGRYDGALGVLSAFEVACELQASSQPLRRPFEAVNWTNEEGAFFQPGLLGSSLFSGRYPLDSVKDNKNSAGERLGTAIDLAIESAISSGAEFRPSPLSVHAYVELHIEQGPVLEAAGRAVGVVTGIPSLRWLRVAVKGQDAHAGTTPLPMRRDAFVVAADIASRLRAAAAAIPGLFFTIGHFVVAPNSPNTIPGAATLTADVRHLDDAVLQRAVCQFQALALSHKGACEVTTSVVNSTTGVTFPSKMTRRVGDICERKGIAAMEMPSGALHDAAPISKITDAGMIFIPSVGGLSHAEEEFSTAAQVDVGVDVLFESVRELCNS